MRKAFLTILTALAVVVSYAQPTMRVQAPNLVASDEQFNVTFTIEGEHAPSDFEWECSDDFKVVWGPQKGTSTSISIVNGKKSVSSQTTYTYILMPKRTGTFQLPSASATVKGETVRSRSVSIEIVGSSSSAQPQSSQGSAQQDDAAQQRSQQISGVSGEDLFMRFFISRNKAVVGETLTATLKLYQRVTIAGFEDARFPSFNGFWSQELQAPSNIEFHRENVGGEIFNSAVLRSWTLIPQQAGVIRIEPAELVCLVNVRAPRASTGSIFDSFFQDDYHTIRKRVSTPAVEVNVSALPGGAPASFCGGVGSFTMNASLSRDSLKTNDAASLKITVSGKGNVALLEAPKISFPPDFEVYDTKVSETASSKTFEYPFIPRSHGDFVLGPVEYSFYDVNAGRYVTLTSAPLPLSVARTEGGVSYGDQNVAAPAARKDVRNLGSDIRYIEREAPDLSHASGMFVGTPLFWLLAALIILAAVAFRILSEKVEKHRSDVVRTRGKAANKVARKRLSAASEYLGRNLYTAFYEELHKALLGYASDRLNMDMSEMSKENIASRLAGCGVPESTASEFASLLDACEFARYAPDSGHEAMSAHYDGAVNVISTVEDCMKKKKISPAATVILISLLLPAAGLRAGECADSLWNAGVAAYDRGDWTAAYGHWNALVEQGADSPELYYNLGNAAFKSSEFGKAVLSYERALKRRQNYPDARYNLERAKEMTQDKVDSVPEFFLKPVLRSVSYMLGSDVWAGLFLFLFAAAAVCALFFLLARTSSGRKAGFFCGLAALLLAVLCLSFSLSQKRAFEDDSEAVVMAAVCTAKSAPADSSTDLFVLHEGTEVSILDATGDWVNLELSDGRQGWIREKDVERI